MAVNHHRARIASQPVNALFDQFITSSTLPYELNNGRKSPHRLER